MPGTKYLSRDEAAALDRNTIRRLAKEAAVLNVSYNTKSENVAKIYDGDYEIVYFEGTYSARPRPITGTPAPVPDVVTESAVEFVQGTSPFDELPTAVDTPEIVTVRDYMGGSETGYGCKTLAEAQAFLPNVLDEELEEYWHEGGKCYIFTEDEVASFRRRVEIAPSTDEADNSVIPALRPPFERRIIDTIDLANATGAAIADAPPSVRVEPKRPFNLSVDADGTSAVSFVLADGSDIVTVDQSHVAFVRIVDALLTDQDPEGFLGLTYAEGTPERAAAVLNVVDTLSDRVKIGTRVLGDGEEDQAVVTFDGEEIHGTVVDAILRYHIEGRDASNIVRFLERVQANPNPRSREQLFEWAGAQHIAIDPDGFLLGFKGVHSGDYKNQYKSSSSGWAVVNGNQQGDEHHRVQIRQHDGDVVEIPFERVNDDHTIGCAFGLHVGSWDYARGFASRTLEVRVDPADVVSVPSDERCQKMRVAKYQVIGEHGKTPVTTIDRQTGEADVAEPTGDLSHLEPEATFNENAALDTVLPKSRIKRLFSRRGRKQT